MNINETKLEEVKEQIQEDLMAYFDNEHRQDLHIICQIVVDNFKTLENKVKWEK